MNKVDAGKLSDLLRCNLFPESYMAMETFDAARKKLVKALTGNPKLADRVRLLMTIPGVGEVTALTWVLERARLIASRVFAVPSAIAAFAARNASRPERLSAALYPNSGTDSFKAR